MSVATALTCRAYVEIAQGELEQAGHDAREALDITADLRGYLNIPETFEYLAYIAADAGSHREAARLFGAATAARLQTCGARFKTLDADNERRVAAVRDSLGESDFHAAWDEGAALTIEEAIAYVRRGRGERKRPPKGWASLTPTELDVVLLACEGLGNKEKEGSGRFCVSLGELVYAQVGKSRAEPGIRESRECDHPRESGM